MMYQSMRGLAAYPTDSYYDPNRPAWMPFWLDDLTESAQKYGLYSGANVNTVYSNPPAPVPPVVQPDLTGQTVDIDTQIAQTAAANAAQTQTFFNQVADTLPNSTTTQPSTNAITWLIVGAGVAVLLAMKKG